MAEAVRTTVLEPTEYSRRIDECVDHHRNRALAEAAWQDFLSHCPGTTYSVDYERGFVAGFDTYLFEGGTGNPPPVPPRYYWRPEYENPAGHRAVEDWFMGYRRGAVVARLSGLRDLVTVPAGAALPRRAPPYPPARPASVPAPARDQPSAAPGEVLPPPRPGTPPEGPAPGGEGGPDRSAAPESAPAGLPPGEVAGALPKG
jgi:hypothetical protein